jgi:hypothetical protein
LCLRRDGAIMNNPFRDNNPGTDRIMITAIIISLLIFIFRKKIFCRPVKQPRQQTIPD